MCVEESKNRRTLVQLRAWEGRVAVRPRQASISKGEWEYSNFKSKSIERKITMGKQGGREAVFYLEQGYYPGARDVVRIFALQDKLLNLHTETTITFALPFPFVYIRIQFLNFLPLWRPGTNVTPAPHSPFGYASVPGKHPNQ